MSPVVRLPNGVTAILCTRGRKKIPTCYQCGFASEFLCDGPGKNGGTCDRPMCSEHRTNVGPNKDVCSTHAAWLAAKAGEQGSLL